MPTRTLPLQTPQPVRPPNRPYTATAVHDSSHRRRRHHRRRPSSDPFGLTTFFAADGAHRNQSARVRQHTCVVDVVRDFDSLGRVLCVWWRQLCYSPVAAALVDGSLLRLMLLLRCCGDCCLCGGVVDVVVNIICRHQSRIPSWPALRTGGAASATRMLGVCVCARRQRRLMYYVFKSCVCVCVCT